MSHGEERDGLRRGELVPGAAIEIAPTKLGCASTPLFVEEGNFVCLAAITHLAHPLWRAGAAAVTTLATSDDPVDVGQIDSGERAKQRFGADETHGGGNSTQMIDTPRIG